MMATSSKSMTQTTDTPKARKRKSQEQTPCIWAVRGHNRYIRGWRAFESDPETEFLPPEMLEAVRLTKGGHFLPAERFPKDNAPMRGDNTHQRRVPQIFGSGFIFIRKESAEVLRQFDLGEGALYPTRLWYPDRVRQVKTEVFFLSQGNWKDAFLKELSPEAYRVWRFEKPDLWSFPPNPKGGELVFSSARLDGPDIWFD